MKVIIEAINSPVIWKEPGETATLRIEALKGFTTSDGQFVAPGGSTKLYLEIPITITGGIPLIPSFEIDSTEDAYPWDNEVTGDVPGYKATIITKQKKVIPYLPKFKVPTLASGDTSFTWAEIRVFNRSFRRRFIGLDRLISVTQVLEWIQNAVGSLSKSSETNVGNTALSWDPVDPSFPVAVSNNDPKWLIASNIGDRLPTADENDALQGTEGDPSDTNRYVTDEDSRVAPATPISLGVSELTVGAADPTTPKTVGDNDTRLANPRIPTGSASGKLRNAYPNPDLSLTGVVPGVYRAPIVTVDAEGRISAAQTGLSFPQSGVADADGTLAGATTAVNALIARMVGMGALLAPSLPLAPTGLVAVPVSTTRIDLAWTDNSSDETGFKIERKTPGGAFAEIATVGAGVATYSNTGLTTDTTYIYRVRAYNGFGNSAYTSQASASTLGPVFAPTLYASFFQNDSTTSIPSADTGQAPIVLDGIMGTRQYAAAIAAIANTSRAFECGVASGYIAFQIVSAGVTQGFVIRADGVDYLAVRVWNSNFDVQQITIGGGNVAVASGSLDSAVADGDWFGVDFNGTSFTLYKKGVIQGTWSSSVNLTATQHGIYLDGVGARVKHLLFTTDHPGASSLQITKPESYKVFQRDGSEQADIVISGTYVGAPISIEARFNNGPWYTLSSSPSGGVFSGTLADQSTGQGWLEVRFGDDHGVVSRIPYVGIGDVFVIAGQSNAEGRISDPQFYSHATLRAGVQDHGSDIGGLGRWREAYDPTDMSNGTVGFVNSVWPLVATALMAAAGVPVGFITTGHGQTGFFGDGGTWLPPSGITYTNEFLPAIHNAETGGIKAILWYQGESDARGETDEAGYIAALELLRSSIASVLGQPTLKLVVAQLANLAVSGFTRTTLDPIRQAQVNAAAAHSNILVGPILYDIDTCTGGAADCIHITTPVHAALEAARWAHMIKLHFYSGTEGRGPIFSAASRVDSTHIDVTFTVGTSPLLPASTDTKAGWRVINSDTNVVLAILSAVRQSSTSVRLTMSAALPTNVKVSWASFNDAVGIALTDSSSDAMPAEPFIEQIVS